MPHDRSNAFSLSVVIPCRDAGRYLEEAVDSVLAQRGEFELAEIVIVDDRSTDPTTLEVLSRLAQHAAIDVTKSTGPAGSAAARNLGIERATGDWIAFLDADDWLLPGSLQTRIDALAAFPQAEWVGGDFIVAHRDGSVDSTGRFEGNLDSYPFLRTAYADARHPIILRRPVAEYLQQAPANTIVSMVSKRLLQSVGGYDEHLLRQQDYHLFLRLAAEADFVFVPSLVAKNRHHESNSTRSIVHTQEWRIVALRRLLTHPDFSGHRAGLRSQIALLHLDNAYQHRRRGDFLRALQASIFATARHPQSGAAWKCLVASVLLRR